MISSCKTRAIGRGPHCSKPSLQGCKHPSSATTSTGGASVIGRLLGGRSNLPHRGRWGMTPLKGTDGPPTSRSTRLASRECGIARRAARRRATAPPSYSADGKAVYMGKGGRCLRHAGREVGEMPNAITVCAPTAQAAVRHWNAGYAERCTSGVGRGRRKRAGNGTSPAAYSTHTLYQAVLSIGETLHIRQ